MSAGNADDPVRHALHAQIQMLLEGVPLASALAAVVDSLVCAAGLVSDSLEDADKTLDDLCADMKREIRTNWQYLQAVRAGAVMADKEREAAPRVPQ